VLKPSEFALHTAKLLEKLCTKYFEQQYISVVNGNAKISAELTALPFDHICFTGSTHVGKLVMKAASENLTPVTLELGGKSPCIVDSNTDISLTAKRIIWGKCYNAGQTCIAPDYVLVQKSLKKDFIKACKFWIREFYGKNIIQNRDYARIINDKHFDRLSSYLKDGKIVVGGRTDKNVLFIEPTLIDKPELDSPLMQEEIFGPILPIIEYQNFDDALSFITARPKPLATYLFSLNKHKHHQLVKTVHTGGITINDTLIHSASRTLPYGGIGASGFGSYHGKAGFDTFTHYKPVLTASQRFDQNLRYPPFGDKLNWVRKIVRFVQ
jgi:acyl-CoA reductase-like NAD-dependent aldehyde dehydrogenase